MITMNIFMLISIAEAATETHTGIGALGLDWRALLFQVLNFVILLGLLRAFAYRPIMAVLESRRQTIEESLRNVQMIAATKTALEQEKKALLAAARTEAERFVDQGKTRGEQVVAAAEEKAQERVAELIAHGEARLAEEVALVRQGLKAEALSLVVAATEKIIDIKLDPVKDEELITKAIRTK